MANGLELYDVTIVGGGPAGLYAAFYSGMRDMKTKLIEAKDELGGRLLIYPEKMVWDVGGVTPIRGEQLIRQLIEQARTFEPEIVLGQQIAGLERLADGTMLLTSDTGEKHWTRTLILAIGYGVSKMVKLELEGADRYEVTNLYYTVTDLERFRGKRVLLSGGGDTALDWAIELEPIAASVTVVHRRPRFGGHEVNVKHLMESSARVFTPYVVSQLQGSGEKIEAAILARVDEDGLPTGETERVEVDAVIVNHGHSHDYGPMAEWGLEMGDWAIQVNRRLATNLPGVFAAGDAIDYEGKLHLIAGAFNDAAVAVNGAKLYLEPDAQSMAYVSSHNAKFNEKNKSLGRSI